MKGQVIMISFTAKVTKKRIAIALLTISAIAVVFATAVISQAGVQTVSGDSAQMRAQFLTSHGYTFDISSEQKKQTIIPSVFDDVYEQYNKLQISQGFDLSDFQGKTVDIYTIKIDNYGENEDNVYATIMVYDGVIIGGDVHSTELDGFMTTF